MNNASQIFGFSSRSNTIYKDGNTRIRVDSVGLLGWIMSPQNSGTS